MLISVTDTMAVSGATAYPPLQTDLLRNSVFRLSDIDREVTGAFVQAINSTNNNTGRVSLYVSDVLIANIDGQTLPADGLKLFPVDAVIPGGSELRAIVEEQVKGCLLYTSPSPRDS